MGNQLWPQFQNGIRKRSITLEFSMTCFLCETLTITVFSADPLLLKSSLPLEKKQFLGCVFSFEQRTRQIPLYAQIENHSVVS